MTTRVITVRAVSWKGNSGIPPTPADDLLVVVEDADDGEEVVSDVVVVAGLGDAASYTV